MGFPHPGFSIFSYSVPTANGVQRRPFRHSTRGDNTSIRPSASPTEARAGVKVPELTFQHGRANVIFSARQAARGAPAGAGKWSSHFPWKDSVPMFIGNIRNGGQTLRHLCVDKQIYDCSGLLYTQTRFISILLFNVSFDSRDIRRDLNL